MKRSTSFSPTTSSFIHRSFTRPRREALTKLYLKAAFNVMPGQSGSNGSAREEASQEKKAKGKFRYVREVVGENDAVLEFVTQIDDITVNGVDIIRFDDQGRIVDFKVMIRPLKAIQKIHAQMAQMLDVLKAKS